MVAENKTKLAGELARIAGDIRSARSLDPAVDAILSVGQLIDMRIPIFIDNVCDERRHDRVYASLGISPDLVGWWRSKPIAEFHPDIHRTRYERLPFRSMLLDGDETRLSVQDIALRERIRSFGILSSFMIPVHLPNGVTSLITWVSDEPGAASSPLVEGAYFGLQGIAYAFIDALQRNKETQPTCVGARKVVLSARERDCVRLVAAGRTMKEVARSLSLSPFTVRDYLGNAMRRFDARNLPQLVSIAWQRGEIGFD